MEASLVRSGIFSVLPERVMLFLKFALGGLYQVTLAVGATDVADYLLRILEEFEKSGAF